jgi:hypothetical protein
MVDGRAFRGIHYAGPEKQLYLAALPTPRGALICLTVFDGESSLGLVRVFTEELGRELASVAPPLEEAPAPVLSVNFETELNRNLAQLFGRAPGKSEVVRC